MVEAPSFITFTLSFTGEDSDFHEIDFYDVSQALIGFQRTIAITSHLIFNGKVINQAPSLKGARIIAHPPEEGSWKIMASVAALTHGIYLLGTAPTDTPLGHLVSSAYDYVISESLGFPVDYDKTLGQQVKEIQEQAPDAKKIQQSHFDSVIEKCENAVKEIHRPIIASNTASKAVISSKYGSTNKQYPPFNLQTYDYVTQTQQSIETEEVYGKVSSFNINTMKGRIFVPDEGRPVPFTLAPATRNANEFLKISNSLTANAESIFTHNQGGFLNCVAFRNISSTGRLKSFYIVEVN